MKQGKIWGTTELIYTDGKNTSVNLLNITKGGYCSEHQHAYKTNIFHVIKGTLRIKTWPSGSAEGQTPDITIIGPGEQTLICSGAWHSFVALEPVECLEIYIGKLCGEDIIRRTPGGIS